MVKHPFMLTLIFILGFVVGRSSYNVDKKAFAVFQTDGKQIDEPLEINTEDSNLIIPPALELVAKINLERQKNHLNILTTNQSLICAAQIHAQDLHGQNDCAHRIQNKPILEARARRCGYPKLNGSELLACRISDLGAVFRMWVESEPHLKILLSPEYVEIGCDVVGEFWVCVLAK